MQDKSWPVRQGLATTDDGIELFYRIAGDGPGPALVCSNGIGVSTFFWKYVVDRFAAERPVVVWDYRGHGRSSRPGPDQQVDIQRCARDLGTICEAAGVERPVLAGHSMGTQVILERYRQAPHDVRGLVSVLGTYGKPLDTFNDAAFARTAFDLFLSFAEGFPRLVDVAGKFLMAQPAAYDIARLTGMVDPRHCSRDDLRDYLHHLTEIGFPFFFRMLRELGEHSAEDLLPRVDVPVLVIAGEFDAFTPNRLARKLDELLPDSELIMLPGATHAGIVEQPEPINTAIADFLARRVGG